MGTSVRKMYDAELLQLDTMLARMGHAAGGAIESAMTALRTGDTELARSVIARDSEIDSAEHEIEHRCLTLFLRQQPVAGDLRKVSTALKMVTDIERIADQASDIAEITLHLHPEGARTVGVLDDLYAMGDIALRMVKDSIAAYVQVDLSTAAQVIARDTIRCHADGHGRIAVFLPVCGSRHLPTLPASPVIAPGCSIAHTAGFVALISPLSAASSSVSTPVRGRPVWASATPIRPLCSCTYIAFPSRSLLPAKTPVL